MSSTKIKEELAPKGFQMYDNSFFISDKYATILTVVTYHKFIGAGFL